MLTGTYSRNTSNSKTFQRNPKRLQKTSSVPRWAGCGKRKPGRCGAWRYGEDWMHPPGISARTGDCYGTYRIVPSRLWHERGGLSETRLPERCFRCRQPAREGRRAYRPSIPVATTMMQRNAGAGTSGEKKFAELWIKYHQRHLWPEADIAQTGAATLRAGRRYQKTEVKTTAPPRRTGSLISSL